MPAIYMRAEDSSEHSIDPVSPVVIAICVLSGLAGICAIVICTRYVWSSESRHLKSGRTTKIILDDALKKLHHQSISTIKPNENPPPYSFNADLRPVSMIPSCSSTAGTTTAGRPIDSSNPPPYR